MNEIIRKRKSTRKYIMTDLEPEILAMVESKILELKPLFTELNYTIRIVKKTKGMFGINAPHYLIFNSEIKEGALENIGFVGQQMDLFFAEIGLGACWLGAAKPQKDQIGDLPFVVSMAFGKTTESIFRELNEYKRKPLSEISIGSDLRLEAARLAPSGINAQNWFFVAEPGKIICYRKIPMMLKMIYERLSVIDIGIAICHIALESENFSFEKETGVPDRKGMVYVGTVIGD